MQVALILYHVSNLPSLSSALSDMRTMLRLAKDGDSVRAYYPLEEGNCLDIIVTADSFGGTRETTRVVKRVVINLEIED